MGLELVIMVLNDPKRTKTTQWAYCLRTMEISKMPGLGRNFTWEPVFDQVSRILCSWPRKMDQKQHNGPIVWEQWKFQNARIKLKFRVGISFWPRITNITVLKGKNRPKTTTNIRGGNAPGSSRSSYWKQSKTRCPRYFQWGRFKIITHK